MNSDKRTEIIRARVVADQAKLENIKGRDIVINAEILRNLSGVESQR